MNRKINTDLLAWSKTKNRGVLLLRGARQVGKTYSMRILGKQFKNYCEVNFEEEPAIKTFFQQGSLNPSPVIEKLSAYYNTPIVSGETLLFFDEIQACPEALRALRFFHENLPDLHVAAAGSLLEFALEEIPSFGVGRIDSRFMYPLSFPEFLEATEGEPLARMVAAAGFARPLDDALHARVLDNLRTYMLVGGMPQVVERYRTERDLRACQKLLETLIVSLADDFAKYGRRVSPQKLGECLNSAAYQAGGKFVYAHISQDASASGYKEALELLVRAGLAHKVYHSAARGIPLGSQIDTGKFKVYVFDIGIYQRLCRLDMSQLLVEDFTQLIHRGPLAETLVAQELIAGHPSHEKPQLFYWHRESRSSSAEVDFVLQKGPDIVPVEIKAGLKGHMRSLHLFMQERESRYGVRISQEPFAAFENLRIIPLYCAGRLSAAEFDPSDGFTATA